MKEMKEILKLRDKFWKQYEIFLKQYSHILKITEAITNLEKTNKKVEQDTKMNDKEKKDLMAKEIVKLKTSIVSYTQNNKWVPFEILQLVGFVESLSKKYWGCSSFSIKKIKLMLFFVYNNFCNMF